MFIIIDVMEHKTYKYIDLIDMWIGFEWITDCRYRYEIPYKIRTYNNGKVIVIRGVE